MYTIGQVAGFLGVSRDTLKYYEEKGLVNPTHDIENGYRKYNQYDIHDVITTNFYREIDMEIKKIQEIRKSKSIVDLECILEEKEAKIVEEIEYRKGLLKKVKAVKDNWNKIKQHLGKFSVKEMKPIEVIGEISDYTAYNEYEIIRNTENVKKPVTLTSARRVIYFDEEGGILEDKFIIVKNAEDTDENHKGEVLIHPKCLYTVLENGRAVDSGNNIDDEVGERLLKIAEDHGYELAGLTYINILLTTYEDGLERVFLEMYSPIKSL